MTDSVIRWSIMFKFYITFCSIFLYYLANYNWLITIIKIFNKMCPYPASFLSCKLWLFFKCWVKSSFLHEEERWSVWRGVLEGVIKNVILLLRCGIWNVNVKKRVEFIKRLFIYHNFNQKNKLNKRVIHGYPGHLTLHPDNRFGR